MRLRNNKKRKVDTKKERIDYFGKEILPLYNTKYFPFKNKINETKILIGFKKSCFFVLFCFLQKVGCLAVTSWPQIHYVAEYDLLLSPPK